MKHSILFAMDGNESLKRVERKREADDGIGVTIEKPDDRIIVSDLLVSRATVDLFKNEVKRRRESEVST